MTGSPVPLTGTFSLIGRDTSADAMGVTVATAAHSVGSRVPHCRYGVGAIATQARTEIRYGIDGLALLRGGLSATQVMEKLLEGAPWASSQQLWHHGLGRRMRRTHRA